MAVLVLLTRSARTKVVPADLAQVALQRLLLCRRGLLGTAERLVIGGMLVLYILDRRGLLARLRTDLLSERDLLRWRTNPQAHSNAAIDSIFELVVRNAGKLRQALPAIESRLKKIPAYLRAGLECIELPEPLWTSLGVQSCAGAVEFLHGLEHELCSLSSKPKPLALTLQSAAKAFEEFAAVIANKKTGPKGGFSIGRERFSSRTCPGFSPTASRSRPSPSSPARCSIKAASAACWPSGSGRSGFGKCSPI